MCRKATTQWTAGLAIALVSASAQDARPAQEWRHVANSAVELGLPSVATGPVSRVWYSQDGAHLFALTASGRAFETSDFEQWRATSDSPILSAETVVAAPRIPEPGARLCQDPARAGRLYAFASQVYRSDDGGLTWSGLTRYRDSSILGSAVTDLAASPANPDELAVANAFGVWHSLDAGLSWTGLNQFLPNLSIQRLLATPSGSHGLLAELSHDGHAVFEWAPGEKVAWKRNSAPTSLERELALRGWLSQTLGASISAVASAGDYTYAGSSDGRLWSSSDLGRTWRPASTPESTGPVQSIFVDPKEPSVALAAQGSRIRRTQNAGIFWDDITANLPTSRVHGVTADIESGAIYVATDSGVFSTMTDLLAAGPATSWTMLAGLPGNSVNDVRLDSGNNQLWVVLDGYGVYTTIAPHRFRNVSVVNAADYSRRPAAPGSVLSVLGAKIDAARSFDLTVPVLSASGSASQIQVPFEASGGSLELTLQSAVRQVNQSISLQPVSPAIFVDPDGAPMLVDADSGLLLDASQAAHSGSHIQILATGLGRVKPDWPTGLPAPLQNPPRVTAQVHVVLDGEPLAVFQAVLAPSYIGFYLVEVELPKIVNAGPAELYIEAQGQSSNRVRIYLEP